jgi:hypothetical protein
VQQAQVPRDDLDIEGVEHSPTLTTEVAVDVTPPVALLALAAQVADKVGALFERHGDDKMPSSRARNLADIAMIATQNSLDRTSLVRHVDREQARRIVAGMLHGPLPSSFSLDPEQRAEWSARWTKATRNAPITFEDAERLSGVFLNPVINGSASGQRWDLGKPRVAARTGRRPGLTRPGMTPPTERVPASAPNRTAPGSPPHAESPVCSSASAARRLAGRSPKTDV